MAKQNVIASGAANQSHFRSTYTIPKLLVRIAERLQHLQSHKFVLCHANNISLRHSLKHQHAVITLALLLLVTFWQF